MLPIRLYSTARVTVDSVPLSERESFGGRPRCHWSRLETRAKEHSVEPSQRVTCNPVATVKAIGRSAVHSTASVDLSFAA